MDVVSIEGLISYILTNTPTFLGLVVTIFVLMRQLDSNAKRHQDEVNRKNDEIERLQGQNNKLLVWCQRCGQIPAEAIFEDKNEA